MQSLDPLPHAEAAIVPPACVQLASGGNPFAVSSPVKDQSVAVAETFFDPAGTKFNIPDHCCAEQTPAMHNTALHASSTRFRRFATDERPANTDTKFSHTRLKHRGEFSLCRFILACLFCRLWTFSIPIGPFLRSLFGTPRRRTLLSGFSFKVHSTPPEIKASSTRKCIKQRRSTCH